MTYIFSYKMLKVAIDGFIVGKNPSSMIFGLLLDRALRDHSLSCYRLINSCRSKTKSLTLCFFKGVLLLYLACLHGSSCCVHSSEMCKLIHLFHRLTTLTIIYFDYSYEYFIHKLFSETKHWKTSSIINLNVTNKTQSARKINETLHRIWVTH